MELLMGNEAIALGALAAGVQLVCGYPGTPSTEVLETVAKRRPEGVYVEWSVNEKAALEVAAGAALAGARAMVTMKQVGLNVASDPLMSLNYLGVEGGAHAVFSCIYEGEPLRIMLYKPVDQSAQGIWAVKSYQDADGIHDYEFEPQRYIDTVETMYEILQSTANLTGGDPALTDPTNVALQYLLDEFEFEPEEYEVIYQSDDIYR